MCSSTSTSPVRPAGSAGRFRARRRRAHQCPVGCRHSGRRAADRGLRCAVPGGTLAAVGHTRMPAPRCPRRIPGLTPATHYEVRVRARNKEGVSPWSAPGEGGTAGVGHERGVEAWLPRFGPINLSHLTPGLLLSFFSCSIPAWPGWRRRLETGTSRLPRASACRVAAGASRDGSPPGRR